jgi:hypothetical protein
MGQYWHCEDERCWRDISGDGERFQCAGCGRWFCLDCSRSFTAGSERVCRECMGIWIGLCRVRGLHPLTGLVRPADYDDLLWQATMQGGVYRGLVE